MYPDLTPAFNSHRKTPSVWTHCSGNVQNKTTQMMHGTTTAMTTPSTLDLLWQCVEVHLAHRQTELFFSSGYLTSGSSSTAGDSISNSSGYPALIGGRPAQTVLSEFAASPNFELDSLSG